jgi:hypothetical protein
MKKLFFPFVLVVSLFIFSCNSQTDAQKKAKEISEITGQADGEEKTELNGAYLTATIDGKKWEATKIGPFYGPESSYKLVSGSTKDITINFQLHKPTTGLKREFRDDNVANFTTNGELFSGNKGEVTVTKVDGPWIEGTFYFTASSPNFSKTYEVTNGTFRVPGN